MIPLLFFTMQLCVIAGSGYDCNWELITTSQDSVDAYCPKAPLEGYTTQGCTDLAKRRVIVHDAQKAELDYLGWIVLWHEIMHAHLYSDCYAKLNDHWQCYEFAYFHE